MRRYALNSAWLVLMVVALCSFALGYADPAANPAADPAANPATPNANPNADAADPAHPVVADPANADPALADPAHAEPASPNASGADPAGSAAKPADAADPATPNGSKPTTADPADSADPSLAEAAAAAASAANPPSIWIWQGDDERPVKVRNPRAGHRYFNPMAETGFWLSIFGDAGLGYTAQNQTAAPTYSTLSSIVDATATGFLYNPRLVSYTLTTSYNRDGNGIGSRSDVSNGLFYAGRLSLLSATPVPFSIAFSRFNQHSDGGLTIPFDTDGRSADLTGNIFKLPVKITYRAGAGDSDSQQLDGHFLDYKYRTAGLALSRTVGGFNFRVSDDFLHSNSRYDVVDSYQTNNYLHAGVDRTFGNRLTTYVQGVWSKYDFQRNALADSDSSNNSDITSVDGGAHLVATDKLDFDLNATFTNNAVNLFQVLAQTSGTPVSNPFPTLSILDTTSRTFNAIGNYRPWKRWTFSGGTNYSNFKLPESLASTVSTTEQQRITNGTLGFTGSAAYNRPIWIFDYSGGFSATAQHYSFAFSDNKGHSTGYNITHGVSTGNEDTLRYGFRFTINHTGNPVFFDLLTSSDRIFEADFITRRLRWFKLNGKLDYRQRRIEYSGSKQDQNSLNFLVTGNSSKIDFSVGRLNTDANSRIFDILTGGGGVPSPGTLFGPLAISRSTSNLASVTWRIHHNLQFDSRYSRFSFSLFGSGSSRNRDSQWDNNATYKLGRFDIIGGIVYFNGNTDNYQRRLNLYYFRLKFPFQLW